jgi:uncharacterized membrane protein
MGLWGKMANSIFKSTFAKLFLFTIIIFTLSLSVLAADNVEVIKYGAQEQTTQVATTNATSATTITVTPSANNVVINKYSSDFLFSLGATNADPAVCICANMYDKILITNTAPYDATFTISTNLPEYVKVPYSNVKLQAGKTIEVNLLINADCNEDQKTLDYNILVANNFGTQYTIERKLAINRCQTITATLYASENKINPCESVNYTVELKNIAPFTEQYFIAPKNTQFFDTDKYEVTLAPNQKSYLSFLYGPDCSVYGTRAIEFDIQSINNKMSAKLNHELVIEKAYDFAVSTNDNVSMCRGSRTLIPIKVKNMANFDNEFTVNIVNKQDFLSMDEPSAIIGSGEEKTFVIAAIPTSSTKTEQILDFEIRTKLGDMVYRGKINLFTNDCYALSVNILADKNPTLCSGTYTYNVLIQNKGLFKERIFLSENSDYSEVFPSTIILDPEESKNVSLVLSLPDENVKNLQFSVYAGTDSQNKTWQDSFSVDVNKKRDCTFLYFEKQNLYARYAANSTSFIVKNAGTTEEKYVLTYEGPEWITLQSDEVTLKPGESTAVGLNLYQDNSTVQKIYNFKINAFAGNDEMYEKDMVLKMTDIPLIQKLYNKATSTICTTASSILIILLILGIIAVVILAWKRVRIPLALKLVALGIIILIIMVVLLARGFPESRYPAINEASNSSYFTWYEDSSYVIDLNQYFYDPDNDTLVFSVEDMPENISIRIDGSKATLTPDKDWSGTSRIRFVAADTYGGTATSARISLNVVEVPEFSWTSFYFRNCIYVNALLLILFLALVFLLRTRKESEPMSRKILLSGIKKEKGYLYFVDKDGDVAKTPMNRTNKKNQTFPKTKVAKTVQIKKKR